MVDQPNDTHWIQLTAFHIKHIDFTCRWIGVVLSRTQIRHLKLQTPEKKTINGFWREVCKERIINLSAQSTAAF